MVVKMDKFDFPEMLEETFRGIIEIIYFYIISIILFLRFPLNIWDKIYREVSKPKSDIDFRNIGLSQPTMFFAISLIIFLYCIKTLFLNKSLISEKIQINEESQTIFLKFIDNITNIYEFNIVVFISILLIANLVFSIIYLRILNQLNNIIIINYFQKYMIKKFFKIKMEIDIIEEFKKIIEKIFHIKFEIRQDDPFSLNWTDINSIHRFIAISNYISGILILLFIVPVIIFLNNLDSVYIMVAVLISIIVVFLPAWFMSIYSIQNDK